MRHPLKNLILIVEDNPIDGMLREASAQAAIAQRPDKEDYDIKVVTNLADATKVMTTQKMFGHKVAAIILDNDFPETAQGVGVPDEANLGRGIAFARVTRSTGNKVPILWNSARFDQDNLAELSKTLDLTPPAITAETRHVTLDANTEAMAKDEFSSRTITDFLTRHLGKERSIPLSLGGR